ncbi:hypothetical protein ABZT02_44920 [Streptomyces sp. NPDC005402]|uniref:hypothetical protein n=1 Tax=Streptomyces sp. NPDC005402 TaxID=3155338 RepID=UPI0033ACD16A
MSENLPAPVSASTNTGALTSSGGGFVNAVAYGVQFTVMVAKLASAGLSLRGVGARVRETYKYIGDCAKSVDHLADLAANLRPAVDADTVGEHRDAAKIMRASLARAQRMANTVDEMSVMFDQAKAAHEGDYGAVNDVATSMTVPMANRNFYRNR